MTMTLTPDPQVTLVSATRNVTVAGEKYLIQTWVFLSQSLTGWKWAQNILTHKTDNNALLANTDFLKDHISNPIETVFAHTALRETHLE